MAEKKSFIKVAVGLPVRKTFTYEVPDEMRAAATPGKRVWVPFGPRFLTGFVLGPSQEIPLGRKLLPIRRVLDEEPLISEKLLPFLEWVAQYYLQPIGEVLKTAVPTGFHLRQGEAYTLTEKGHHLLKNLSPSTMEMKVLQAIKHREGKTPLLKVLSGKIFPSSQLSIEKLLGEGYIQKSDSLLIPKTVPKTISFIKFINKKDEVSLSPLQQEALDFIRQAGELPLREFKEKYEKAASILSRFKKNQLVEMIQKEEYRQPSWIGLEDWIDGPPSLLTENQKKAISDIGQAIRQKRFSPFLLHGVTGSGKTEVYLRVMEDAIAQGGQGLLLVPEIALTAQLVAYFRSRIHYPMAVLHSGLATGERYDEWRRIKKGLAKLVIGARSAIFAPLNNLRILIVDEEHDPSYKQEDKVRYNARDLALVRGKMEDAVVVLGSATPSMESYYNTLGNKIRYLSLPSRIDNRPLPEIQVLDMRQEQGEGKERVLFSRTLEEALRQNAARGEQALLFLNRRGFSTFALCGECGFVYKCPNCSVSLIYHLADKIFRCHYCGYSLPALARCPECASIRLMLFGLGTQRIEEQVKIKFPGIRVGRMDRDTTTRKASHQKILNQVRRGEINLLIGTQMITKGHDLPRVTLVGVLAADLSLNLPDFRAGERTFQLLTQVAGRAGRGERPGKVIVQTYNPNHYSINFAKDHDFYSFYKQEAKFRQEMSYPPFARLVNFRMEGNVETRVLKYARMMEQLTSGLLRDEESFQGKVEVLGPTMAPLGRLRGKYRFQMLLKGKRWSILHRFAEKVLEKAGGKMSIAGVKLTVDVDPVNML